jgi:hypothetical protein
VADPGVRSGGSYAAGSSPNGPAVTEVTLRDQVALLAPVLVPELPRIDAGIACADRGFGL